MSDAGLLHEVRDGAMWLTLNRPAALNSLDPALLDGLGRAVGDAATDPQVRAVVITGSGRAFCAGADLVHVRSALAAGTHMDFLAEVNSVFNRLEALPKPTIAAVNGIAAAGGLELALCCDLILAAEGARIGDGHANYGLLPGGGASIRLPRRMSPTWARYLLFTGRLVPARDLLPSGLLLSVVADDGLLDATTTLVQDLAGKSPLALARVKELAALAPHVSVEHGLQAERVASELHLHSADLAEGVAAFVEKRTPTFAGR